jgi:hypothetical protein
MTVRDGRKVFIRLDSLDSEEELDDERGVMCFRGCSAVIGKSGQSSPFKSNLLLIW